MRIALNCVVALASSFFIFGLAYLGLFIPGAFVIAGLDVVLFFLIFFLTGKKEDVNAFTNNVGKYCKERVEVFGELGNVGAGVAAELGVQAVKAAGTFTKTIYDEMGGREGAEKAVKGMAKGVEEAGKLCATGVIELGKAGANIARHAVDKLETGRQEREMKKLEDAVDAAYRIVNIVERGDDD